MANRHFPGKTIDWFHDWISRMDKLPDKDFRVRAVNKLGARGKPSVFVLDHGDAPFGKP